MLLIEFISLVRSQCLVTWLQQFFPFQAFGSPTLEHFHNFLPCDVHNFRGLQWNTFSVLLSRFIIVIILISRFHICVGEPQSSSGNLLSCVLNGFQVLQILGPWDVIPRLLWPTVVSNNRHNKQRASQQGSLTAAVLMDLIFMWLYFYFIPCYLSRLGALKCGCGSVHLISLS